MTEPPPEGRDTPTGPQSSTTGPGPEGTPPPAPSHPPESLPRATVVVDASVLAVALADDEEDGARIRARLSGCRLVTPNVTDLEILTVWRRASAAGTLDERRAGLARRDLADLPLDRIAPGPVLDRCWDLQERVHGSEAACLALAEALDVPLLTADRRLAAYPGARCDIELLQ